MKWLDRTVTADEWDRLNDLHQARYDEIEAQVIAERRAEWEAEFGDSPKFPFKPSPASVHREVMRRIKK